MKKQELDTSGETVYYPNLSDWQEHFWEHDYLIRLTEHGILFAVNADCEQDAIDYLIDYCEVDLPGLVMSREEEEEEEEFLEEYICGGNHGIYLNTYYINIEEVQ